MGRNKGKSDACAIVLAAGLGKRMKSAIPKVLHEVAGKPMVYWAIRKALDAGADPVVVVVGFGAESVKQRVLELFPKHTNKIRFALQSKQLGTADAVKVALHELEDVDSQTAYILAGDVPLLKASTLRQLLRLKTKHDAAVAMLTAVLDDPTGYGRVLRSASGDGEFVAAIIEDKDAKGVVRQVGEVNAGVYAVDLDFLRSAIGRINNENAQREYYLTDIVAIANADGLRVVPFIAEDSSEMMGVNDRLQLSEAEYLMRIEINRKWALSGVTMPDPTTVRIDPDVKLGKDVVLYPGVELRGSCSVGDGVVVETGCIVSNSRILSGAHIKPYTVIEDSVVGEDTDVGPFAHLRPGSVLKRKSKVGNFTELKKTTLGEGSKANHLSYLGDATIGKGVNIGAGTITCNYDGAYKHKTTISDGVFIGSDVQLVAPVKVGKNATVAAGTTVYKDVPAGALAITRVEQINKKDYFQKYMLPRLKAAGKIE